MPFFTTWVDIAIIGFLFLYAGSGISRGFLALLAEMLSFLLSFLFALHFYPPAANILTQNFSLSLSFAKAIAFIALAILSETVIATILTSLYRRLPSSLFHSPLNRLLGILPAFLDALILMAFLLTALISLPLPLSAKGAILSSPLGSLLITKTRTIELSLNKVFGGAVEDTLSFLTVKPASTETIDLHFRTQNFSPDTASESKMLILVNNERTSRALKPLVFDSRLRDVARSHSQDMLSRGYFSHVDPDAKDPFDHMHAAGITFLTAGENLAYAPTLTIAHEGLMQSPEHRANILNPDFGHLGIGVLDAGLYGKMFTQEFTD